MLYFRGEIDESKSQLLLPVLVPLLKPLQILYRGQLIKVYSTIHTYVGLTLVAERWIHKALEVKVICGSLEDNAECGLSL